MSMINNQYKDRIFTFIFGNPDNKELTLSLYNAVNGSDYKDPEDIEFTTIRDAVYMGMRNDVSFLVNNVMSLYEHQSSYNPNMPLRFFLYMAMVYERYIDSHKICKFSSKLQKIPTPKCICFYNGSKKMGDKTILRLSDSFDKTPVESDIDVKVTMLNINYGYNKAILDSCKSLNDYAWLIAEIRNNQKLMEKEDAVDKAITDLAANSPIKSFLMANRAEVKHMYITEYNEEQALAQQRNDGYNEGRAVGVEEGRAVGLEEGRAEGLEKGKILTFNSLVQDGTITIEEAISKLNITEQEFHNLVNTYCDK